jgi:hypothetical protein
MDFSRASSSAVLPAVPDRRLPLGVRADGEMTRSGVAFAFALGTLTVVLAFPLGILAIVLSNMGMNRVSTKPATARRLVAWSWAIFGVTDGLIVLAIVVALIAHS